MQPCRSSQRCFERAGFADGRTVLSSSNVVFAARAASETALGRSALLMAKRTARASPPKRAADAMLIGWEI